MWGESYTDDEDWEQLAMSIVRFLGLILFLSFYHLRIVIVSQRYTMLFSHPPLFHTLYMIHILHSPGFAGLIEKIVQFPMPTVQAGEMIEIGEFQAESLYIKQSQIHGVCSLHGC